MQTLNIIENKLAIGIKINVVTLVDYTKVQCDI